MSCNQIIIEGISGSECIGDSLPKINNNFSALEEAACNLFSLVDEVSAAIGSTSTEHGDHTGDITSVGLVTTYNNVIPSNKGGAGTVNGILSADGSGNVAAAEAGVDYVTVSQLSAKIDRPETASNGQVLTYNGGSDTWIAANPPTGGGGGTMDNLTGDVTSIGAATTYANVLPANKGGAGTVNGILKANGSGTVSAAVSGVDYVVPSALTNKIDNPASKSAGHVLTYNGTTWIASNVSSSVIQTVFDPATKLASTGNNHYGFSYITKKGIFKRGYVGQESGDQYYTRPIKIPFYEKYLENNPTVYPVKCHHNLYNQFVLLSDGTFWGHGQANLWSQSAKGSRYLVPLNVGLLTGKVITDFSVNDNGNGYQHITIGVTCSDGTGYVWGNNTWGQIGNGTTTSSTVPVQINIPGKTVAQVSVGGYHTSAGTNTLVRMTDGSLYAAGWNGYGALGVGNTTNQTSFVQCKYKDGATIGNLLNVAEIFEFHDSNMGYTRFIRTSSNYLWGAGLNNGGQLGIGSTTSSSYFVKPSGGFNADSLDIHGNVVGSIQKLNSAGWSTQTTMVALDTGGRIYTWGDNAYGTTGQGLVADSLVPVLVDVYQKTPTSTAALPPIKNIFGHRSGNQGSIGLISESGDVFVAGTYVYNPITGITAGEEPHSRTFKRFEKRYDLSNIVEGIFYDNSLNDGGSYATGCVVRDVDGVLWGWGVERGGVLGVGLDGDVISCAIPLNTFSR